jgi:hypothetical protein
MTVAGGNDKAACFFRIVEQSCRQNVNRNGLTDRTDLQAFGFLNAGKAVNRGNDCGCSVRTET